MIVSKLKKSLLQYAISGKICEQIKTDTSVDNMLVSINSQKLKCKTRLDKFQDSENKNIPFNIPNSWRWVELKDICLDIYAGGDKPKIFSKIKNNECFIPVIANGETNDGIVGYTNVAMENEKALTVAGRGTIGFSKIRMTPFTPIVRLIVIKLPKEINYKYLQRVFELLIESGVGTSIKQLTVPMIVNKMIPIPPIEEQKRIVDKIEELFAKLDEIKPIEDELEMIKSVFPNIMEKSILESAIMGKLSRQNLDEKITLVIDKIHKITPPFDIPKNWSWYSHNDLFEIVGGSQPPKSKFSSQKKEGYIRLYQIRDYGPSPQPIYVKKDDVTKFSNKGDIILARYGGSLGKVFWAESGAYNVALAKVIIKYPQIINKKYLYYYYLADLYQSKVKNGNRSAQAGFSKDDLNDLPFPLPPLEEQKRIVDKLEQLLPICDDIEKIVGELNEH